MNSDNKSYLTSIAISFTITRSCVAIRLRLLARKVQRLPLLADDYTIIAGALFTISNALPHIHANRNVINNWKTIYVSYQLYGLAITAIKVSILLFCRRIFPTSQFCLWTNIVGFLCHCMAARPKLGGRVSMQPSAKSLGA
ncbi:MAG: hypothetical protein FRX48_05270 [Lasallia pustulata]|uniref:Rhodopsin domain-containing protein n=1 Tax=Lasallia pustulata TaxID=136370 RepID=A0A5M8PN61_9LECA|nr:MAG: hypothetical protein FRX48_05270 [Lasallia pustulata]